MPLPIVIALSPRIKMHEAGLSQPRSAEPSQLTQIHENNCLKPFLLGMGFWYFVVAKANLTRAMEKTMQEEVKF